MGDRSGGRPAPARWPRRRRGALGLAAAALAAAAGLAGCGGGSEQVVVRPPSGSVAPTGTASTSTSTTSTTSTTSPAPTASTATTSTAAPTGPTVQVRPATGLRDGQVVSVRVQGFTPHSTLVVVECVPSGAATGPGDCNLDGLVTVVVDARGQATTSFTVAKGPFGSSQVRCGARDGCVVSASPPTPSPTEQASATIRFR